MNEEKKIKIIGLTGPIGAGKDAAAKSLKRRKALVIDADKVAHTLYEIQSPLWHKLVKAFGARILNRGGKINRKKLAEIVFSDKGKLLELNRIVHPALREVIIQKAESGKQNAEHRKIIVINAAVLKEIGLVDYVDEVWVVVASKAKRVARLIKSGLPKGEALKRINSQKPQNDYLKLADVVIKNDGTLRQLNAKVQAHL
jgi:dephospho-CoA kinase